MCEKHLYIIAGCNSAGKTTASFTFCRNTELQGICKCGRIELAKERVRLRVQAGGHNIPEDVIARRYVRGINNLFEIYLPICNNALIVNNSSNPWTTILSKENEEETIHDPISLQKIKEISNG